MVNELAKRIRSVIESFDSVVAGSSAEREVADTLVQFLEQLNGIEYRVENIHVKTWTPIKAFLSVCGAEYSAKLWPQCTSGSDVIEARVIGLEEALADSRSLQGYAILAPLSREEARLRSLYSLLARRKPSLLVLRGDNGTRLALTEAPFTLTHFCTASTPVVSVPERVAGSLLRCGRARLIYQDERGWAESPLIEAWSSKRESSLLVTTSIDSLGSPRAQAWGLAVALGLFIQLMRSGIGARLAILPASQLGDPVHPGYVVGYGARIYSKILGETPLGDTITLSVHVVPSHDTFGLVYPGYLGPGHGKHLESREDLLWSNATPFTLQGFPSIILGVSPSHGVENLKPVRGLVARLRSLVANWSSLVDSCTGFFYAKALEKPVPRLHSVVYKLRRIAEKSLDQGDLLSAISACRVLVKVAYRVMSLSNRVPRLGVTLFPPLGCIEEGLRDCYDVETGARVVLGEENRDVYSVAASYLIDSLERVYEEYYVRGFFANGSL